MFKKNELNSFEYCEEMGSSSLFWKTSTPLAFNQSKLVLVLVPILLLPLAGKCSGGVNSVLGTPLESSSLPRKLGNELQFESRIKRALLESSGTDPSATNIVTVNKFGTGDYATVQEAIDGVPIHNTQRVVIIIFPGTYREKVRIPSTKPFITLHGIGDSSPVITWNDTAASVGSTWDSSTVSVDAAHFIARGVTFENTAPAPLPGAVGAQAVAMRIGGDMAAFYDCNFLGAQDTLCDWMGRHYFRNCFIQGTIDFIFGNGQSLYERCLLNSIAQTGGSLTAHYRQTSEDPGGYSFVNCNITGTGHILLGRAWGPYSRVVFSKTTMADMIDPKGWGDWGNASSDGSVYYGEYNNFGTGADLTERVSYSRALTEAEAEPFLTLGWINGTDWLGYPF